MLPSMRNPTRSALVLAALLALCARVSTAATRPDDYVARAKQITRMLYPGLDRWLRPVIVAESGLGGPDSVNPDIMNAFFLELHDLEPGLGKAPRACWCSDPVLSARFLFDWQTEKKELLDLLAFGPGVFGRRDEFAEEVARHPEWSDAEVVKAMNEAGAKFGPEHKAELLRALPLEGLAPFMGGQIEVVSAEFMVQHLGSRNPNLIWWVRANWHGSGGREADCTLMLEPFEGKLQGVSREALTHKVGGPPPAK